MAAGQFGGRIWFGWMLWRIGHRRPQRVRVSDGRPSAARPKLVPCASKLKAMWELMALASRNCRCKAPLVYNPRAPLAANSSDTASVQRLTEKAPSRRDLVLAAI